MRRIQQSLLLWSPLLVLTLLAGCGVNGTTNDSSAPTIGTSTPSAPAGTVTLQTDALLYRTGDLIAVTISNQTHQTISFPDHQTNCTVVLLQRRSVQPQASDGTPVGIDPCKLMIATRMHQLAPGQHLVVKLVAPSTGWPSGVYLATLSYRTSLTTSPLVTLASSAFTVGSAGAQP